MIASRGSIPSTSEHVVNSNAFESPFDGGTGGDPLESASSLIATPLSNSESDIASSSHPYHPNLPGFSTPDYFSVHGVASTDYRGCMNEDDIVIAVMGPTGAGKSSFVNKAAGKMEVVMGHDLKSQTRKVQPVRCTHPKGRRNIVLVDTPGFNDTQLSDLQILRIIAEWLRQTYQSNIKLAGILYLHRISDPRMAGTPLRNLAVFKDLCGNDNLKNIVLVTTMWDEIEDLSVGSKREEELRSKYWKGMIHLGSDTSRFQGTRESAWEIIDRLNLDDPRQRQVPLQIQQEMVDHHLPFEKTMAVKTLLRFLMAEMKKVWTWLRVGTRRVFGAGRPSESLRQHALRRSPTWRSSSSATGSAVSPTDTSNDLSPTGSASTGCNVSGRQDTLSATITALRLVYQVADMAAIPMVRGAIGTVLQIAQLIEEMGGTHHAITQVIEYAGWLLEEIVQFTAKYKLSKDMKKTLSSFTKELNHLRDVVTKISSRSNLARSFLYDADIQAIMTCTNSIRAIYDRVEVKLAMDNREAMARLENQLRELCNGTALRQCQCGMSVLREESQEPESSEQYSVRVDTGQS